MARAKLSWLHVAAIAFFCVGGPFGFEESLSATNCPALSFWGLMIMAIGWALPQSMIIAELSSKFAHGYTEWCLQGLGPVLGCAHGWIRSLCNLCTNLTYCALFADYFLALVLGPVQVDALGYWPNVGWRLAAVVPYMGVILAGNLVGVRLVGWASILFTVLVTAPFVVMFALAIPHLHLVEILTDFSLKDLYTSSTSSETQTEAAAPFAALTTAEWNVLVSVLIFNLIGWDDVGNLAQSVKRVSFDLPVGILLCLVMVISTYVAPLLSVAAMLTPAEYYVNMYSTACARLWKPLGTIMDADSLLGIFGLGFIYMTTSSEAQAHCSTLGLYPRFIGLRTKRKTPWLAMIIQTVIITILAPLSSFSQAVEIQSWLYAASVAIITISFLVLRYKTRRLKKVPKDIFQIQFHFVILVAMCLPVMILCTCCLLLASLRAIIICGGMVILFTVISFILNRKGIINAGVIYHKLETETALSSDGEEIVPKKYYHSTWSKQTPPLVDEKSSLINTSPDKKDVEAAAPEVLPQVYRTPSFLEDEPTQQQETTSVIIQPETTEAPVVQPAVATPEITEPLVPAPEAIQPAPITTTAQPANNLIIEQGAVEASATQLISTPASVKEAADDGVS